MVTNGGNMWGTHQELINFQKNQSSTAPVLSGDAIILHFKMGSSRKAFSPEFSDDPKYPNTSMGSPSKSSQASLRFQFFGVWHIQLPTRRLLIGYLLPMAHLAEEKTNGCYCQVSIDNVQQRTTGTGELTLWYAVYIYVHTISPITVYLYIYI